jgi:hypothetical protein
MLNLASNAVLRGLIGAELQKSVDLYYEAHKQLGHVRFDRPLFDANDQPIRAEDGSVLPDLMTEFRTLATKLDKRMEFAKTPQVIEFVRQALGTSFVMPAAFTLTPYGARPEKTVVDEITGVISTKRALKAQVIASFGAPPSRLSADAQARNAAVASKWDAIVQTASVPSTSAAAPEVPPTTPAAPAASEV